MTDSDTLLRRSHELSILNTIAEGLNREIDLDRALYTTLERVVQLFDLRTGWIWLLREDSGEFYLASALHLPPALADVPRRMEGWCHCRESYEEGEMRGASNINIIQCSRLKGLVEGTDGLRAHASVPLYAHDKPLGILNVLSSDWRELSADDLRLLTTIGDLLSIAVERARLFARSAQLGAAEERNRIARDIHDTLAQGMSATALQLEMADALLESGVDTAQVRRVIGRALDLTRANIEDARRSVLDLRAAPLEGKTLSQALQELVQNAIAGHHLQVDYEIDRELRPLPQRIEIGLYRIAQEALTNILRHSNAAELDIVLHSTPEQIELGIGDDGRGFDTESIPKGRFGLIGISERARLMGGTLEICSAPDEGTWLRIVVPLAESAASKHSA